MEEGHHLAVKSDTAPITQGVELCFRIGEFFNLNEFGAKAVLLDAGNTHHSL